MSRTSLSAVPVGRAAVYAAAGLQGAVVVTFFVGVQLLLNRNYFSLPAAQYAAVYVPVFAAAVLAALFAARRSRRAARGPMLRLGLALSTAGRVAMIPTVVAAVRHAAVFFPDLVIIGALTGAGFGLVYSAATAFELDIDPARPERHLLRLTLALAAGMAAGPLLQIGLVEAGLWWVLPLTFIVLAVLLIAVSPRSRLGPDAARTCALRHPARPVPARVKAYVPAAFVAVAAAVITVAWSQASMIGPTPDEISAGVLGLGAFWPALTVLAHAGFSAIDMQASRRREASAALFFLPAVVTVTGLAIGHSETAVIGIYILAAVVCAAFIPPMPQLTDQQLVMLPLILGAGTISIYPVAIALARPTLNGLRSGSTLPMIFGMTGIMAAAAAIACAGLITSRQARRPRQSFNPAQAPATPPAPPDAAEQPPPKTPGHRDDDQPG